jgi:hypothetical protein
MGGTNLGSCSIVDVSIWVHKVCILLQFKGHEKKSHGGWDNGAQGFSLYA